MLSAQNMHCLACSLDDTERALLLQVKDNKGDTLEYPKVVQSLPFWDKANTYFFDDDYLVNCNGEFSDQSGGKVGRPLLLYFKPV